MTAIALGLSWPVVWYVDICMCRNVHLWHRCVKITFVCNFKKKCRYKCHKHLAVCVAQNLCFLLSDFFHLLVLFQGNPAPYKTVNAIALQDTTILRQVYDIFCIWLQLQLKFFIETGKVPPSTYKLPHFADNIFENNVYFPSFERPLCF